MTYPVENFKPQFLFRNRHIQTMLSPLTRKETRLPNSKPWSITREGITLHGKLHSSKSNHHHIVVVFHGLGGHVDSPYVTGVASGLIQKDFSVLRMSLRGGDDDSTQTYHAGQIQDIEWIVDHLHSQGFKVSLMGFSLSSSMILKWLEHERNIQHAFLVSPPINLDKCAQRLDKFQNKLYQKYFLRKLKKLLEKKCIAHPHLFQQFMNPKTFTSIRAFDSHFTAIRNGFSSADEYYSISSPLNLEKIQNQVCILHSKDDPFIDFQELETIKKLNKPNLRIHLTDFGGHVGFYQGLDEGYMIDRWVADYFDQHLL
jgi:predicted alpha/beta-fold hydrolase